MSEFDARMGQFLELSFHSFGRIVTLQVGHSESSAEETEHDIYLQSKNPNFGKRTESPYRPPAKAKWNMFREC